MDAKLQEVLLDYGLEGYGLYWYCIELIAQRVTTNNLTFELEHDTRIIARNTGSTPQKVEEMMKTFIRLGLLNHDNGHVFCLTLAKRCDDFTAKAVRREGIKSLTNQSVGVSPTNSEKVPLEVEDRREVEVEDRSKKKNKENVVSDSVCQLKIIKEDGFNYWYKAYPKKVAKPDAEKAFKAATKKMKEEEFMEFVDFISSDSIKRYKETDKQFMPAPAKYIRQELYNDE
jgi:hypothetical protein